MNQFAYITKVEGLQFEAAIFSDSLTELQQAALGLDLEVIHELQVTGDFGIFMNQYEYSVQVKQVTVWNGDKSLDVTGSVSGIETSLQQKLEEAAVIN